MATIERIEPAYTPWAPSASGFPAASDRPYTGRHRRPATRGLRLFKMFYTGRHRRL
jgi:hypothetical protein